MFFSIYKATIKNLLRSKTFNLALALVLGVALYEAINVVYGYFDFELMEYIDSNDPRFTYDKFYFTCSSYRAKIHNSYVGNIMMYAMPLFSIITTVLIVNRDHSDRFFEIEKACGVKPKRYLLGRMAALVTINFVVMTAATMLSLYWELFTHGGVADMSAIAVVWDSIGRILRYTIILGIPNCLIFIGLTYAIGCVCKSGVIAAMISMSFAIFNYTYTYMYHFRGWPTYFDYLAPQADKLRGYLASFDMENPVEFMKSYGTNLSYAILTLCVLLGIGLLYLGISYLSIRKRST